MIGSFSDIIEKMKYHLKHKNEGYSIPMMPKYNKVVGNIQPGQYTVISGMPSSGKTSFVDENYVLGVLLQWYALEDRPPLKIFYFSLKDSALKKFQLLLCGYIKLVHNHRIDIPTLNSQPGRIYDIEKEPEILKALDDAEIFFNELISEGVLEVITDVSKPVAINAVVSEYLITQPEYEGSNLPLTMVVVDSTDHLSSETDGFRAVSGLDLDNKFDNYISNLVKEYGVHAVIITPAHGAGSRFPKENEPNYRQLGVYGRNCDKGVILYNPIAEGNTNYLRSVTQAAYISASGLNALRFWHVVSNADGVDSVDNRILFLPGTSYMVEADMTLQLETFNEVKDFLYNVGVNPFYKRPVEADPEEESETDSVATEE